MKSHQQNQFRSDLFIREACHNKQVFLLQNKEGFITCQSNIDTEWESEIPDVFCVWSNETLVKANQKSHWPSAKIVKISLEEFMEAWCTGMEEDGYLVGINLDTNLFGQEILGYELILELLDTCEKENIVLQLKRFPDIKTFRKAVLVVS